MNVLGLFRSAAAIDYEAGSIIFREGDAGDKMYVVREGEVEVRVGNRVVEVVGEGGIFGEMALIDDAPRSASAVARTACKLVAVDQRGFTFLIQQTPFFSIQVMQLMAERLRRIDAATTATD